MTEEQARAWLGSRFGEGALRHLERFVALLLAESERQSLIARSTTESTWVRHIVDSAQLVDMARATGTWVDVGSGGGLPGIVVAILRDAPLVMIEPRRKRADFLCWACEQLELPNASVIQGSVQGYDGHADVLSARAVAPLETLFGWTRAVVSRETLYLLPRGENALTDLEIARRAWHGSFHVEQSQTDPRAGIVVATGVRPR